MLKAWPRFQIHRQRVGLGNLDFKKVPERMKLVGRGTKQERDTVSDKILLEM